MHSDVKQRLAALSDEQRRLLAQRLTRAAAPDVSAAIPRRRGDSSILPTSFAQQRIWFIHQLGAATSAFTVTEINRLTGPLDLGALERSIAEIVRRHESLRTTFLVIDGEPFQRIAPTLHVPIALEDLQALPADAREREAAARVDREVSRPWDLERGPLIRVHAWRLAADDHMVAILVHHVVSDGWSKNLLRQELTTLYQAFSRDEASPLPDLPIQYGDFSVWQRQALDGDGRDRLLDYWKRQLAGASVLQLPGERGAAADGMGLHRWVLVPDVLLRELKALSRQEQATLFMTMLAAFALQLSRYSGQDDVVVGTPVACRNRVEIENLIGCFMNPLPLRISLAGNPTFRELVGRVRQAALGAYAHQDAPFDLIVRAVHARRDLSAAPLFQAMFLLQNLNWQTLSLSSSGLDQRPMHVDQDAFANAGDEAVAGDLTYPVALEAFELRDRIAGRFEYSRDFEPLFGRAPDHYRALLEALAANPDARIDSASMLTASERRRIVHDWNRDRRCAFDLQPASRLFEAQAARTPDRGAVTFAGETVTYAELNRRANRLARHLQARGVGPEAPVGIVLERSIDAIAAVVAVMKAGGAYVPLDPNYPQDRQAFILRDAGVRAIVTVRALSDRFGDAAGHGSSPAVICLDADRAAIDAEDAGNLTSQPDLRNLAYLIYTSGSTGRPKGTMVTHASLANAYLAWERAYGLRTDVSVHLQMASLSFDVFSGDLVRALCSGGRLVLVPQDHLYDATELYRLMRAEGVDIAEFVPAVLRDVARHAADTAQRLDFLHLLIVGSDSWFASEHRRVRDLCSPKARFVNSYGVTESTIDSSFFENASTDLQADAMAPIGRAFANTELFVVDARFDLAPIGVTGELCIGGAGLARGYLRRPDLTAEKFVPNPFADADGARLYRTGDLARYLPDGNVELLGRMDHQVKLRGFRIEVGEIESVIARHESIAEVAVTLREDTPGDKRLVAYVVAAGGAEVSAADLRRFVREQVPEYMVPSAVVTMAALPLTPNGKIDRRALPAPDRSRQVDDAYVPPGTEVERSLSQIWTDLLGVDRVGIHDNFFDLGGHSLLLIQLHSRLRQRFEQAISVLDLFMFPTIHALAAKFTRPGHAADAQLDAAHARAARQRDAIKQRRLLEQARAVAG